MFNAEILFSQIINKDLCTLCGSCAGVCPSEVFKFNGKTMDVNAAKCNNCGACTSVCPGKEFNFNYFNHKLFDSEACKHQQDIGSYFKIYKGFSKDPSIRSKSASGGVATAILMNALKKNIISGAVVIAPSSASPTAFDVVIAKTTEEILAAAQSKYVFIPTNKILNHIKSLPGRYAYVGLPCQIHGLRKAMDTDKALADKITLVIGLFCGFNTYQRATDFILKKCGLDLCNIARIEYRAKRDQKTGLRITTKDNREYFIPKNEYSALFLLCTNKRCLKCYDFTAEFSDISIGDAWESEDCSRIICRSAYAKELLSQELCEYIHLNNSDEQDIFDTQSHLIMHKKHNIWVRAKLFRDFPQYGIEPMKLSKQQKRKAMAFYYFHKFASNRCCFRLLRVLPFSMLRKLNKLIAQDEKSQSSPRIVALYIVFGVVSTLFNYLSFLFLTSISVDYKVANIIALISSKILAYITNKLIVFRTRYNGIKSLLSEMLRFILARSFVGVIDYFGLIALVSLIGMNTQISKAIILVLTTILNYFFSKKAVFKIAK